MPVVPKVQSCLCFICLKPPLLHHPHGRNTQSQCLGRSERRYVTSLRLLWLQEAVKNNDFHIFIVVHGLHSVSKHDHVFITFERSGWVPVIHWKPGRWEVQYCQCKSLGKSKLVTSLLQSGNQARDLFCDVKKDTPRPYQGLYPFAWLSLLVVMSYIVNVRIIALRLVAFFDSDRFRVLLPPQRNNNCTTSSRMLFDQIA